MNGLQIEIAKMSETIWLTKIWNVQRIFTKKMCKLENPFKNKLYYYLLSWPLVNMWGQPVDISNCNYATNLHQDPENIKYSLCL